MKKLKLVLLLFFSFALLIGCAGKSQEVAIDPDIPDSSPLAKVEKSMSMQHVIDLIGEPNERNTNLSGKQFIPFSLGGDYTHTVFYYKDLGRVTFNGAKQVIRVEYNKSENSYVDSENN